MDYLFLMFEDTKERLSERYGVDVSNEGVDPQVGEQTLSNDTCTQVVCYYRNKNGGLGCFSWAGNTVLIDDEDYEARKDNCLLYTSPSPRDRQKSRMPSSA